MTTPTASPPPRWLRAWLLSLLCVGLVSRLAPLFDPKRRLWQWPTEDGYLMMTIAENIALGHGMAVSGGTVATNGTQPFTTFVWTIAFSLSPDRYAAVSVVQILETALSIAIAVLIHRVGARLLRGPRAKDIASIAAAAWFASPLIVPHSMNCLESSMYALSVFTAIALMRSDTPWTWARTALVGVALSWAFYSRNDAVFLIGAVCLSHWLLGVRRDGSWFGRPLLESILMGTITVVLAIPWLRYNLTFGHITPISGVSEAHDGILGWNLRLLPSKVFEYITLYAPIPEGIEITPPVIAVTLTIVAVAGYAAYTWWRTALPMPAEEFWSVLGFGAALCAYYGILFGAPHFMSRYLFPLSPFFALAWGALFVFAIQRLQDRQLWLILAAAAILLSSTFGAFRSFQRGTDNGHRGMVDFIRANATPETWVGSSQSGTLGFFHEKTHNLDGKVNPEALEAKLRREVPQYIVDKKELIFVVDWMGLLDWWKAHPVLREEFDLVIQDPARNVAGMKRRH